MQHSQAALQLGAHFPCPPILCHLAQPPTRSPGWDWPLPAKLGPWESPHTPWSPIPDSVPQTKLLGGERGPAAACSDGEVSPQHPRLLRGQQRPRVVSGCPPFSAPVPVWLPRGYFVRQKLGLAGVGLPCTGAEAGGQAAWMQPLSPSLLRMAAQKRLFSSILSSCISTFFTKEIAQK